MPATKKPIVVFGAIAANLGIAVAKFVAAAATGSSAMLSEGIHSLVDTGDGVLPYVGLRLSRRPADEAASPMQSNPGRDQRSSRSTVTVSSLTSAQLRISPTRSRAAMQHVVSIRG